MYADAAPSSTGGAAAAPSHDLSTRQAQDGQDAPAPRRECGVINTLRTRVLLLVAAAGLATVLALGLLLVGSVRHFGLDLIYQQCSSLATRLLALHPDMMSQIANDRMGFTDRMRAYLLLEPHTGIDVVDGKGVVLLSTGYGRMPSTTTRYDLGAIRTHLAETPGSPIKLADPVNPYKPRILAAHPVTPDPDGPWLIVSARTTDVVMEMSDIVDAYVLKTGGKATVLALVIGFILTMGVLAILTRPLILLTRRIDRLRQTSTADTARSLDDFPFTGRQDEIGHLARAFRETFSRLHEETRRVLTTDERRRDMVASVSHDLRTPLTALLGQLEVVRTKETSLPADERNRLIDAAFNNAQQLKRLTDALAELGRLENPELKPEFEPIAVHELCDDVASRYMSRAATGGQTLVVDFPDRMPLAKVDAQLLDRALGNLIDNAMRVTPVGGQVRIDIQPLRIDDTEAIRIAVADTGPGVGPEDRERVFERFYQGGGAHRANRGSSGLGLAIVSRVAELHRGIAGLEHPADGGACFYLLLPLDPLRTGIRPQAGPRQP